MRIGKPLHTIDLHLHGHKAAERGFRRARSPFVVIDYHLTPSVSAWWRARFEEAQWYLSSAARDDSRALDSHLT